MKRLDGLRAAGRGADGKMCVDGMMGGVEWPELNWSVRVRDAPRPPLGGAFGVDCGVGFGVTAVDSVSSTASVG